VLAIPRTIGKIPPFRTLVPDRRGVAAVVLLAISAAAPLTAVAGVAPTGLALTGLTGVSHAYLAVAAVPALFSVDHVAMARHIINAAACDVYIAPGLSRPAGVCASSVALSACILFECASYVDSGRPPRWRAVRFAVLLALLPRAMSGGGRVN